MARLGRHDDGEPELAGQLPGPACRVGETDKRARVVKRDEPLAYQTRRGVPFPLGQQRGRRRLRVAGSKERRERREIAGGVEWTNLHLTSPFTTMQRMRSSNRDGLARSPDPTPSPLSREERG